MMSITLPYSFVEFCLGTHYVDEQKDLRAELADGTCFPVSMHFGATHFCLKFDAAALQFKTQPADVVIAGVTEVTVPDKIEIFSESYMTTEDSYVIQEEIVSSVVQPNQTTFVNSKASQSDLKLEAEIPDSYTEVHSLAVQKPGHQSSKPVSLLNPRLHAGDKQTGGVVNLVQQVRVKKVIVTPYQGPAISPIKAQKLQDVLLENELKQQNQGEHVEYMADVDGSSLYVKSEVGASEETTGLILDTSRLETLDTSRLETLDTSRPETLDTSRLETWHELHAHATDTKYGVFKGEEHHGTDTEVVPQEEQDETFYSNEEFLSRSVEEYDLEQESQEERDAYDVEPGEEDPDGMREPFFCTMCGHMCRSHLGLKQHLLKLHSMYKCKHCDNCYTEFINMREHMKTHTTSKHFKAYQCQYCWFSFAKCKTWQKHEQKHLIQEPHACETCGKRFKTEEILKTHMENHVKSSEKGALQCSYCSKQFTLKCRLTKHEAAHVATKEYPCDMCDAKFQTLGSLKVHQRKHQDPSTWPFKCEYCPERFIAKQQLQRHTSGQHSRERPYPCSICGKGFAQETDCKRHEETHSELRPYPCSYCDMWFKKELHLRTHEKLHSGVLPFECVHCGRKFATKQAHIQHERTKHTKELPFKCPKCFKGFALKSILNQHVKKHAAEVFQCSVCYKKFSVHSALHQHQKVHRMGSYSTCAYCDKVYSPHIPGTTPIDSSGQTQILIEVVGENAAHIQDVVREVVINNQ